MIRAPAFCLSPQIQPSVTFGAEGVVLSPDGDRVQDTEMAPRSSIDERGALLHLVNILLPGDETRIRA